jgi:hypothetical protein
MAMPITLPTSEYRELARWFPTVADRARALGRSRETVTGWERGRLECTVQPSSARQITRVASVAEEVEQLMGDARGVGRWMLAPQPQFLGKTPVEMIAAGRLVDLSKVVYGGQGITPRRRVSRARRGPRNAVGFPRQRERVRSGAEAAVLRRVGEEDALIGPVEQTADRRSSSVAE